MEEKMSELYVGNVSKQIQMFAYRSLERQGIITQVIPIGGQIRISPNGATTDLTTPEIEYIINQHRMYGLMPIEELDSNKGPFNGLCYCIGKAISPEKLRKAMHRNEEALAKLGQQMRQEAALAVNSQIEESIGGPLRTLEMSFTEEEPRAGYAEDLDHLAEGVRVTRSGDKVAAIDSGRRGRR